MKHGCYKSIFILYFTIYFQLANAESTIHTSNDVLFKDFEQTQGRIWINAEYLQWLLRNPNVSIPMVTSGLPQASLPGAIGQPGAQILIGNSSIDTGSYLGGQFVLGYWLDAQKKLGIEGTYFFLSPKETDQNKSTTGQPGSAILAAPVFDVSGYTTSNKLPGQSIYVLPGPIDNGSGFAGNFSLAIKNRLHGAELNSLFNLYNTTCLRVDGLVGVRWIQFIERLTYDVKTTGVSGSEFEGQFFNSEDKFDTFNNFYGPQLGIRANYNHIKYFGQASARVALGDMNERADIHGQTNTSSGTLFFPIQDFSNSLINGGIYAQPSNIGQHRKNAFAVVPELDLKFGYHVKSYISVFAVYSLIYISHIARPGDLLNCEINTTQTGLADAARASGSDIPIIGSSSPSFKFHNSSFWTQGISVGIEVSY